MKKKKSLKFIRVPHNFFTGKENNGVTPEELRLYWQLRTYELEFHEGCLMSVDILNSLLPLKFSTRENRNKVTIKEMLFSLKRKGHIIFDVDDFDYREVTMIMFPKLNGYTQVDVDWNNLIKDHQEFAVMCIIIKNTNYNRNQFSYADVFATPKRPKPDGLACPRIDEYNVHISEKEKDASFT